MKRRRSCLVIVFLGLILGLLFMGALALVPVRNGLSVLELGYLRLWLARQDTTLNTPIGSDDTPRIFVVEPGDNAAIVGNRLATNGLISDADVFRNYVRYAALDSRLEAGTYFITVSQTIPEIALLLTDSSKASVTVRILEGWRREQIAQAIDDNPLLQFSGGDFLAVTNPGAIVPAEFAAYVNLPAGVSLEGFLYPDTYALPPDATASDLRDKLLATFQERVGDTLRASAEQAGLTLFEAVTVASIVEREAVQQDEQPMIASVYLNRLAIGMTLDADPTVQYGLGFRGGAWWPAITQADYRTAISPYNTYLNGGLPPGPIANPALPAIQAAITPAASDYLYFRATCDGSGYHVFAYTFEEHLANGNCP